MKGRGTQSVDEEPGARSKARTSGWTIAAVVIGNIGLVPFLVAATLDSIGVIDIGNGLGFGLLLWLCGGIAAVLVAIGEFSDRSAP